MYLLLGLMVLSGCALFPKMDVGYIEINPDITLRRMIIRNPKAKEVVLFLHGFPETIYAWKDISMKLGKDYEVHAFDWPGYGLSSRPTADKFSYSPRDYAHVLRDYIKKSGIDSSKLVIYSTDIGSLPALLLAIEEPKLTKRIIVGDFAPFNRPEYMYESLQNLKTQATANQTRAFMNKNRDEILENTFRRGLAKEEQYELSKEFKDDMAKGWDQPHLTAADAFYYYYSHFTRDQDYLEANISKIKTPVDVIWGEKDFYIKKEMGLELAKKLKTNLRILPNMGHYPHLQNPESILSELR